MQRLLLKIVPALTLASLLTFTSSSAQTSGFRLKTADSLFQQKRYTQSFDHYEEILHQHQYTPAMLLKMAYIQEGLNHIGSAMYYLNLYYIATGDKTVLSKMSELADKYKLEGYETTDSDRFWSFYLEYHLYISLALAVIIILLLSITYHSRVKRHQRPTGSFVTLILLAILLAIHQYYGTFRSKGIIADASTYIMDGPSAGASVIDVVGDGHRVDIIGKKDVWMKIRWEDGIAYVKKNAVRMVRL
jgi:hypothetical protein